MAKRTNTATWVESTQRWRIAVQKDGTRKQFYSSKPGRTGQREANAKADAWLEDGIQARGERVEAVYKQWYESVQQTTSKSNYRPLESRWRIWVLPVIGNKRVTAITERDLQSVVDKAYSAGKSKKTLDSICVDLRAFFKFCRHCKLCSFHPEDLHVPAGARLKGKKILQPDELRALFSIDTTLYRGKRVPDDYINAYRFQVLTGLRPGELVGLQWDDIKGNTVNVCRSVNIEHETTRGKNDNAVRSFVLSEQARQVLDTQRQKTGTQASVFCLLGEKQYYDRWRRYCRSNDLQPVSLYELRHTFVSVVKTLPAGEIKPIVGHSQDMDTFGIYGHALTGEGEQTAAAINGIFLRVIKNA